MTSIRTRRARGRAWAVLALSMWVLPVACSGESDGSDPAPMGSAPGAASATDDVSATPRLLTVDDVAAVPGISSSLEKLKPSNGESQTGDRPRGPCGAELNWPPARTGEKVMFAGEGLLIMQELFSVETSTAENVVAMFRSDIDPDCPPFTSQTATGRNQTNDFLRQVELPAETGNVVATISYVHAEAGLPLHVATAVFQRDGTLGVLAMSSGTEISDDVFRALAESAMEKL